MIYGPYAGTMLKAKSAGMRCELPETLNSSCSASVNLQGPGEFSATPSLGIPIFTTYTSSSLGFLSNWALLLYMHGIPGEASPVLFTKETFIFTLVLTCTTSVCTSQCSFCQIESNQVNLISIYFRYGPMSIRVSWITDFSTYLWHLIPPTRLVNMYKLLEVFKIKGLEAVSVIPRN